MRMALSDNCRALSYARPDWQREQEYLKRNGDPQPCPCCNCRGFYAPRADDSGRRYRACKFCGFWQNVGSPPHEIIRYECRGSNHWVADWKGPHESWTCPRCGEVYRPEQAAAWPADDVSHWWHEAPKKGAQQDYRDFWTTKCVTVSRFGIP